MSLLANSDYVVWGYRDEGNSCLLEPPAGLDRQWELYEGSPTLSRLPPDVRLRMSDDHRRNIGLPDNVMNLGTLIIASERLSAFLQVRGLKHVEYLPVTLINHKGRVASRSYSIVHPVHPQDCLDRQKSGCTYSNISPGDIIEVKRLVLDVTKIEPDIELFRIKDFGFPVIVRRSLADAIQAAGFTGVLFTEFDEYAGEEPQDEDE
ncbi:MAG TPA: DUF1629 domain-containing protein [Candidatus Nanopelagicales bacterium]|nr:DUF1629 domain-containing protein [Candidatus Nanopelagicales bacterium]